ncbi:hypothetical protein KJ708_01495 [bacterium]|nr:hypothetical protein [bacterium]MBU1917080.1 hypothetical protein [bacterium]
MCLFLHSCSGAIQNNNTTTASLRQCAIPSGYQTCTKSDSGVCTEWSAAQACDDGETCSNGMCSTTCTNECSEGEKQCTLTGYQECGEFDDDLCLEWGENNLCEVNESCSLGACHPLSECSDECETNATRCTVAEDAYQTCGLYDADTCTDWGAITQCNDDEMCSAGSCGTACNCHYKEVYCEASAPDSSTKCSCDPDCSGSEACSSDGYCDHWCPAGEDPDCEECVCNTTLFCDALEDESIETCDCDPDCHIHGEACSADGHCDTFCDPEGVNNDSDCDDCAPSCPENYRNCSPQWIRLAWYYGNEMELYDSYENPDPVEGEPWVLLSPDLGIEVGPGGSARQFFQFPTDLLECVTDIKITVVAYDDSPYSFLGVGAKVRIYNMETYSYELLSVPVGDSLTSYVNYVSNTSPYLFCGETYCFLLVAITTDDWDNTHLNYIEVLVAVSEP